MTKISGKIESVSIDGQKFSIPKGATPFVLDPWTQLDENGTVFQFKRGLLTLTLYSLINTKQWFLTCGNFRKDEAYDLKTTDANQAKIEAVRIAKLEIEQLKRDLSPLEGK